MNEKHEKPQQPKQTNRELSDDELKQVGGGVSSYQHGQGGTSLALPDLDAGGNALVRAVQKF
jgi:hypothetical protein